MVLLVGTAFAACIFAQSSSQAPPLGRVLIRRGPAPHSQQRESLLTFEIAVFDAKGTPFRDLRPIDLDITDDGKLMHAVFCRPVETADREAAPLGPQSTLILLDLLNANLRERAYAWSEIVSALRTQEIAGQLYLYLLTKSGSLYPVHALPDAGSPSPPNDESWTAQVQLLLDRAMREVEGLRPSALQNDVDARVGKTLEVFGKLASDFALLPGRKSLVWVSHGFPMGAVAYNRSWHDYTASVMRLGTLFARSGIMVYTVNQSERGGADLQSTETLRHIAGLTGGDWLPNNATAKAIWQALGDGPAIYEVGYSPPIERWDGKFHKVHIAARSKEGGRLRVRGIEGYYGDVPSH